MHVEKECIVSGTLPLDLDALEFWGMLGGTIRERTYAQHRIV